MKCLSIAKCTTPFGISIKWTSFLSGLKPTAGVQGHGFTYSIIPYGAREVCSLVRTSIDSLIKDMNPLNHEQVWYEMWRKMDWVGRGGIAVLAIAAVDTALWDLKSKIAGIPLHRLLGAYRDKEVPVYNTGRRLAQSFLGSTRKKKPETIGSVQAFAAPKSRWESDDPVEDVERIAAVRKVLGPNRTLMVDANERFTQAEAVRRAAMWEEFLTSFGLKNRCRRKTSAATPP